MKLVDKVVITNGTLFDSFTGHHRNGCAAGYRIDQAGAS